MRHDGTRPASSNTPHHATSGMATRSDGQPRAQVLEWHRVVGACLDSGSADSEPTDTCAAVTRRTWRRLATGRAAGHDSHERPRDRIIVVGEFQRYRAGAIRAGMPVPSLINARRSVRAAWEAVQADIAPGDIVLIKGRDTQKLDRVALALQGRKVGCEVEFCKLKLRCEICPALATGPGGALN